MKRWRRLSITATAAVLVAMWSVQPLHAQAAALEQELSFTGTHLPPHHWAVLAVRRAEALMLTRDHLPAQNSLPLEVVERVLREAMVAAPERVPEVAQLTAAWHARLLDEFRGVEAAAGGAEPLRLGLATSVGVEAREGAVAPGLAEFEPERTGALPLEDRVSGVLRQEVRLAWGEHFGLRFAPELAIHGAYVNGLELNAGLGAFGISAGRLPLAFGGGVGGSILLGGFAPIDGVQIETRESLRLPSVLGYLGPVSFQVTGGKMTESRHPGDPYFWAASGHFQPIRRFTIGIHRAALFGGDPENHPVTLRNILDMLIGRVAGVGFEDQIVSVSGRLHLPTEAVLPLTAYLEWGAEDAAGSWWDVPGRVIGLESASLPFLPEVSAGIEFTHFASSCCGNPKWYRHWSFPGSWASRDRPLGHPLGGDGRELLVHITADLPEPALLVSARAFARDRREENLFSPERLGRSAGLFGQLSWRPTRHTELRLDATGERGDDWTELQGGVNMSYFF